MITNIWYKSKLSFVPFVPTDIAGCQLWLKADEGITKDGSNYVSAWDDQSGNGNNAIQNTGSAQPQILTNELNGMSSVYFSGTKYMLFSGINANGNISIFTVNKALDSSGNNAAVLGTLTDYDYRHAIATSSFYYQFGNSATSVSLSSYNLIESIDNGTNVKIYKNGNIVNTIPNVDSYIYIQQLGALTGGHTYALKGNICELILYTNTLSDIERQKVENYLNTKYALW